MKKTSSKEKRKNISSIVSGFFISVMCIWLVYISTKVMLTEPVGSGNFIMGAFSCVLTFGGIFTGIKQMSRAKREKEQEWMDKQIFSEKKQQEDRIRESMAEKLSLGRHETVEQEIYWHSLKSYSAFGIVLLIFVGILELLFYLLTGDMLLYFLYIAGILFVFILFMILQALLGIPSYKYKRIVRKRGYSLDDINQDFVAGKQFRMGASYLIIGKQYTIYLYQMKPQIIRNTEITRIYGTKQSMEQYENGVIYMGTDKSYYVNVISRYGSMKIFCSSEGIQKLILDTFSSVVTKDI